MGFPAAEARLFQNVWVCMDCSHKQRSSAGKKPGKCRTCGATNWRNKKKKKKSA